LDGDPGDWLGWPSKLVGITMLFFKLVVLASYTASLAAFLTRSNIRLVGPSVRQDLIGQPMCAANVVSAGYSLVLTGGEGTVLTPPLETAIQGPIPSLAWCAEKVLSGEAGGILHPESEPQLFLLNHGGCDNFAYAPAMRSTFSDVFEFALGGPDAFSIAANLTRGLYHLKGELNYVELGEEYLLRGRLCPGGDNVEESETQVDLKHLSGLLILTYAALCIAILGGVGERVIRGTRLGKKKSDGEFQAENLGEISRPAELNENQVSRRTSKKCDENDTGKGEGTVVEGKAQMAVELKEVSISREIL
jgi:hypothetical protein